MNKVILKTALGTLASLALAAILVFSLWILISPQTMASLSEKTGNYSFAVTCADLRYKYSGDVEDLARCAQNSISARKDKLIVKYGEKLTSDEGFESLCEKQNEYFASTEYGAYAADYKGYICGNIAAAQYRTGSFDKALQTAKRSASYGNLVLEIVKNGTVEEAGKVLEEYTGSDEALIKDETLIKILQDFINK